jgi:hypothetical protein
MIGAIQKRVFVGFGNANLSVLQVLCHPVRGDENIRPGVAAFIDEFAHSEPLFVLMLGTRRRVHVRANTAVYGGPL